ncbi:MAG: glycosyltransferase family 2 protein [Acidimicrobiales bacterium]
MTPLVSVIVPTYKAGPLLSEALESLRAQTVPDWEAVVVADGLEIDRFRLPTDPARTRVLEVSRRGVCRARNLGIAATSSPWIALLDDDDIWLPTKLEMQLTVCEQRSDAAICFTGAALLDSGRVYAELTPHLVTYHSLLADQSPLAASSLLFRRSALDDCGVFDPVYPLAQDFDLVLRIARHYSVVGTTEVLVHRRWHQGNASHRYLAQYREAHEILSRHLRLAREEGEIELCHAIQSGMRAGKKGFARATYRRSALAWKQREPSAAAHHLLRAFHFSPSEAGSLVFHSARRHLTALNGD